LGHPLLDEISRHAEKATQIDQWKKETGISDQPIIAVLPGSRKQEVSLHLIVFLYN
jgi:lipid-A-disaccharide synthase